MLLVKTYLDKSPINGIGLFAAEFIPKGTVIWDFNDYFDKKFNINEMTFFTDVIGNYLKKYCYLDGNKYVLCNDDARFMNHSDASNTSNGEGDKTIANYDIQIGEEITCNYYEIDDSASEKI